MEILTLLKANIRRKKGSFVSVILLTLIIAMSVTTILSIRESSLSGVDRAHESCGTPDIRANYMALNLSDELIDQVKNDSRVKSVNVVDTIISEKSVMDDKEYTNTMFLMKAGDNTKLLNEKLNGVIDDAPELQKGEIYVSQGLLTNLGGKVGQTITVNTLDGKHEFIVKGIFLDPMFGSSMIGWKSFLVGEDDYSEIEAAVLKAETKEKHGLGKIMEIYKADDCTLTNALFRRQLNLDTGFTDMAIGSSTREMLINYTTQAPITICSILMVFIMLLLAIVVIVTVHSISVEIEMNYVTFGVLKAQGFDKNKIRLLFMGQYLMAEVIGAVIGTVLSVPLIGVCSNIFVTITGAPAVMSIPAGIIAVILAALFALSAAAIFFVTMKVNKISPVRAISGAKNEIYFDSRLNAPISKKLLSPSLALRKFTSAKRRYIGTLVIVTLLVFFMMTVTVLANTITSKSAMESMGVLVAEINVTPKNKLSDSDFENVEKEIERFTDIKKVYYTNYSYYSFNGEEMMGNVYKDLSFMSALKGRIPEYDNEIAVSPILLEEFELKIGDEVTIGRRGKKDTFLITGTTQLFNDLGRFFIMSEDAAARIGDYPTLRGNYSLENGEDEELNQSIVDALNEKFGDKLEASAMGEIMDDTTTAAIKAMQIIIYVFSILFSLIVVHMVCSKAFIQERTDIGIFKAAGFKTSDLRAQFAFRFLIVSVIGSAAGGVLSCLFSGRMLEVMLKSIGVTSVNTNLFFSTFAIPIAIICSSFLIFSYLVSGKIKKVKIRELVTE